MIKNPKNLPVGIGSMLKCKDLGLHRIIVSEYALSNKYSSFPRYWVINIWDFGRITTDNLRTDHFESSGYDWEVVELE